MEIVNLAIIEDDKIIRDSLESYFSDMLNVELQLISDSVESFVSALKVIRNPKIDIILLDIGLPGISGLEGIAPLKRLIPQASIIILTSFEEEEKIFKALCAGATSYLSKRTPLNKISEAVLTVSRGGAYMSPSIAKKVVDYFKPEQKPMEDLTGRQQQIVQGILDGLSYKMIADKYMITLDTVRDHIKKIYRTLHINSKAELMRKMMNK